MTFYQAFRLWWNRKLEIPGVDGSGHGFHDSCEFLWEKRFSVVFRSPCEFLAAGMELD